MSDTSMLDQLEDDSVLKSIYAKIIGGEAPERQRVDSNASVNEAEAKRMSIYKAASRPTSATIDQPSTCHQRLAAIIIPTNPSSASRPSRPMATLSTTARRIHSTTDCLSMSMTVEDTFEFMHNRPTRRRVESDASSFYFHAPASQQNGGCGHRRQQSNMSVSSLAPPIGLYNRSFGHHRRNDSSASTNSVAVSFPKHGTNPGVPA
ncbi:unnamed protein product [Cyclocybe aegerita]|uniref:Uncharacterized protein n=1 Tax=Cyclocybe aegerita TaxID=1973307 RepID=A0A8S0Y0U1_CYCAE|nr:unnamed protein product [Cyclocybe aegerita]